MSDALRFILTFIMIELVYIFAYFQGKRDTLRKLNSQVGVSREENL